MVERMCLVVLELRAWLGEAVPWAGGRVLRAALLVVAMNFPFPYFLFSTSPPAVAEALVSSANLKMLAIRRLGGKLCWAFPDHAFRVELMGTPTRVIFCHFPLSDLRSRWLSWWIRWWEILPACTLAPPDGLPLAIPAEFLGQTSHLFREMNVGRIWSLKLAMATLRWYRGL